MNTLPNHVVELDHALDATATTAQGDLARLRWHWTLDESNPDRVSIYAYGKAVGRSDRAVRAMAHGYAAWVTDEFVSHSLTDAIELAKLGADKRIATEAVAEATGLSVGNVASAHRDKVKETLRAAADAAERKGTSVTEEIPRIAQAHERQRQSAARQREERKRSRTMRYIEIEGHLAAAKDRLAKALTAAHDVELDGEETELIVDMLRQVNAALRLLDVRFGGISGVDWDAEAASLGGAR